MFVQRIASAKYAMRFTDYNECGGVDFHNLFLYFSCSLANMDKRYGFVYVDVDDYGSGTYARYKKKSFDWYQKVIASNGAQLGE